MKSMIWKPEYSIHDDRVDEQHRRLFDLFNRICDDSSKADLEELMHELYAYAVFHFAEEEALMATINYPPKLIDQHTRLHQSFFKSLERLRRQSVDTALEFFREWLIHHILTEDKEIGRFQESQLR